MAFGNSIDNDDAEMSEINMTPLVDVMLVLLIIFMLTMPVLTHSVKIDLAEANSTPSENLPETISISLTETGQIFWNDLSLSHSDLLLKLQQSAQQEPQAAIQLRADKTLRYEQVIKIMSAVQAAGIQHLGFITETEK